MNLTEKNMLNGMIRFTLSWEWGAMELEEKAAELQVLRDESVPLDEKLLVLVNVMGRKR